MPVRYFSSRPSAMPMMMWEGDNLEEIRDFWETKGFSRYDFDVDANGNLTNPSGTPLEPGTLTMPAGGFGYSTEAQILEGMQEVANPVGIRYSIVEES
jgi:hypothetical protein